MKSLLKCCARLRFHKVCVLMIGSGQRKKIWQAYSPFQIPIARGWDPVYVMLIFLKSQGNILLHFPKKKYVFYFFPLLLLLNIIQFIK